MLFDSIVGQPVAVGCLRQALEMGRVHHAMRFEGPDGVGKEMAAMAVAQALVCTSDNPLGCGVCSACERAVTLCDTPPHVPLHPDVILLQRGLYPPEVIGHTRGELKELSVDQVRRVVLERMAFGPHEGKARVFIIRAAEELSVSAANALLKILEEPGKNTYFILLVTRPAKLLSTIRSRTLRIRFAPLQDDLLADILMQHDVSQEQAQSVLGLSQGSVSAALTLIDEEASELRDAFVRQATQALASPDAGEVLAFAEKHGQNKALVRPHLEALAVYFADCARSAAVQQHPGASTLAQRFQYVLEAIRQLDANASATLLLESLMLRLRAQAGAG